MRFAIVSMLTFFLGSLPFPLLAQTPYLFEVDTTRSSINLYVRLSPPGSSESDETMARLIGSVIASLTPAVAPFSNIQITDMDLTLHDALDLRLDFGFLAGRINITAPPGEISLVLTESGTPSTVVEESFTQTNNTFSIGGTLDLDASGIISLGVADEAELDSELKFDIAGTITQDENRLQLQLPLAIADTSEISGVPLVLRIDGFVVATSDVLSGEIPVELTAFTAVLEGERALLRWETASEQNNAGFDVEHRSPTSDAFTRLTHIRGHGTTLEPQRYQHEVQHLMPGRHVFRLRQVDYDGAFAYSPEVEVTVEVTATFHLSEVYPNPFNPQAQFTLTVRQAQQVEVGLYNLLGQRVEVLHAGIMEAEQTYLLRLDGSGLPSGAYFVRVHGEHFMATQRVMLIK